ncbi:MAG: AraC family ligand binding domain-containing protein, partial [Trichococcus sp.]|nr:AraC family ligand binding domain-containing protein [Trichococcus sp.]
MFELDRILKEETKVEKEQRKSGFNVTDPDILDELILSGNKFRLNGNFLLSEEMFFKKGDVHIRKHNRYSDMPLHHHQFLELNYMYSGSCTQEVSGEKIVLNEGDIIMLDRGSSHSFQALGENDILINVLLKVETINTKILQQLVRKRGVLTEFLVLASQRIHEEDQFLVFRTGENAKVQTFMHYILEEYYGEAEPNIEVIHLYLPLLFMELARTFEEETKEKQRHQNQVVTEALAIIEKDYRMLSLEMLAQQLGFNKNYLGNLIKKETG